ncbi:DUF4112 domain-containing protein [Paracoccus marcusii]|uniref:DUF4112 domain-containing protein n=1 Tax=Paracoccus marcusii TaxID=59779 RepID=UPI0035A6D16C
MNDDLHKARFEWLEQLSGKLDSVFRIPGTRFRVGYDAIAGLVPGLGDAAAMLPAAWIVLESYRMGLPRHKLVRQGINVAVDTTFGSIPLVGSVFDAWFKSNLRNVDILRSHLNRDRLAGVGAPYGDERSS